MCPLDVRLAANMVGVPHVVFIPAAAPAPAAPPLAGRDLFAGICMGVLATLFLCSAAPPTPTPRVQLSELDHVWRSGICISEREFKQEVMQAVDFRLKRRECPAENFLPVYMYLQNMADRIDHMSRYHRLVSEVVELCVGDAVGKESRDTFP